MHNIYVFGSTGNSLWLAKEISVGIRESISGAEVRVLSIPALTRSGEWNIEGETAGFVFPCYYATAPRILREFVDKAREIKTPFLWAFASGGRTTGVSVSALGERLEARGARLSLGGSALIASNYMNGWYYSLLLPSEGKLAKNLDRARIAARETGRKIAFREMGLPRENRVAARLPALLSPARYIVDTRPWAKEFSVGDGCSGCGACARMCPVGNVTLAPRAGGRPRPEFGSSCERCMACFQFCPSGALSIEGVRMNKKRYRNPFVTEKELERFNAMGSLDD